MQKMKQEVVKDIRTNQQLETDLNEMDIKIGLLVKNRLTLQVRAHGYSRPLSGLYCSVSIASVIKQLVEL